MALPPVHPSACVTSRTCWRNAEWRCPTARPFGVKELNHFRTDDRGRPTKASPEASYDLTHLDEVYLKIDGRLVYLWRAVDAEGEVLDVLVQSKLNKQAALKLMRKLLRKYAFVPERLVTDDLRSYSAAVRVLGIERRHKRGAMEEQSRAENS